MRNTVSLLVNILFLVTIAFSFPVAGDQSVPQLKVNLGIKTSIDSTHLGEQRDIFIRLPKDYEQTKRQYPVIYLLDANNEILTYLGDLYFYSIVQIERMINAGDIPEAIIVGIPFSAAQWGSNVTTNTDPFRAFLTDELLPSIAKKYRVLDNNVLVGQSYTANFVTNTLAKTPDVFDSLVAIDPILDQSALGTILTNYAQAQKTTSFLHVLTSHSFFSDVDFIQNAIEKRPKGTINAAFETLDDQSHVSIYYAALGKGLKRHFADFRAPDKNTVLANNLQHFDIVKHYKHRDKTYQITTTDRVINSALHNAFNYYVTAKQFDQAFMIWDKWQSGNKVYNANRQVSRFLRKDDKISAITILSKLIQKQPRLPQFHYQLNKIYAADNQPKKAAEHQRYLSHIISDINSKDSLQELNRFGYMLLAGGEVDDAIELFKKLSIVFADSANAFDSLADAYEAAKNPTLAISALKQGLKIAKPDNKAMIGHIKQRLKHLGEL